MSTPVAFLLLLAAVGAFAMLLAGAYLTGDGNREGPVVLAGSLVCLATVIAAVILQA